MRFLDNSSVRYSRRAVLIAQTVGQAMAEKDTPKEVGPLPRTASPLSDARLIKAGPLAAR